MRFLRLLLCINRIFLIQANTILPHSHSHHLHCLPTLMKMAASFDIAPEKRLWVPPPRHATDGTGLARRMSVMQNYRPVLSCYIKQLMSREVALKSMVFADERVLPSTTWSVFMRRRSEASNLTVSTWTTSCAHQEHCTTVETSTLNLRETFSLSRYAHYITYSCSVSLAGSLLYQDCVFFLLDLKEVIRKSSFGV